MLSVPSEIFCFLRATSMGRSEISYDRIDRYNNLNVSSLIEKRVANVCSDYTNIFCTELLYTENISRPKPEY